MSKFIMLVGTPLEGKSKYAECYKKQNDNVKVFSTDGYKKDYEEENCSKGTKVGFYNNINSHLVNGYEVVLDANNLSKANRETVYKKITAPCEIIIVKVSTPLETRYARLREKRTQKIQNLITDQKLFFLNKGLEFPTKNEDERIVLIKEFDSVKGIEKVLYSKEQIVVSEMPLETPENNLFLFDVKKFDFNTHLISIEKTAVSEEKTFSSFEDIASFVGISKKGMNRFLTHLEKAINNHIVAYGYLWKTIPKPINSAEVKNVEPNVLDSQKETADKSNLSKQTIESFYDKLNIKPKLKGNTLMKADKKTLESQMIVLKKELSECDLKSNDMLHIAEFNEINSARDFVDTLKALRKYRREVKNEIEFVEFLLSKVPEKYNCKTLENIEF